MKCLFSSFALYSDVVDTIPNPNISILSFWDNSYIYYEYFFLKNENFGELKKKILKSLFCMPVIFSEVDNDHML